MKVKENPKATKNMVKKVLDYTIDIIYESAKPEEKEKSIDLIASDFVDFFYPKLDNESHFYIVDETKKQYFAF